MDKFQINFDEFINVVVPNDNKVPLKGNEHRITRVAFDLFRFKDGNPEELWQVQSSDDGEFLVRTYSLPEEEEIKISSSKWSTDIDKKEENITIAYNNIPILRLAGRNFFANTTEDVRLLQRMVYKKLSTDNEFVNSLVRALSSEKREILKGAGLTTFSKIDPKLVALEERLGKTAKDKETEKLLDFSAKQMFGRNRKESIKDKICVVCGKEAKEFDDDLSKKEYQISGLCQKCQNATFNEE